MDLISLYIAADAKFKLGVDIPHTCLGPTCREYERCLEEDATEECKRDLAKQAFIQAASLAIPIIPIGESAIQCVSGDCEACGTTAVAFVPSIAEAWSGKKRPLREANEPPARKTAEKPANIGGPELASRFEKPAPTATQLRIKEAVRNAAERAGSEVMIGGEKHPLAPTGKGDPRGGFKLCTECALLADKLAALEEILSADSERANKVRFVRQRASGYDAAYRRGQLPQSAIDQAARNLRDDLKNTVMKDPFIEQLLNMDLEELRNNRAALKEHAAKSPIPKRPTAEAGARVPSGKDVITSGSGPLVPGKSALGQYGIDKYGSFSNRPGDRLAGHELLQNLWLETHGFGERLEKPASKLNPAVGLTQAEHAAVGREQQARDLGLKDRKRVAKMSALENIEANELAMKRARVPNEVIEALKAEALRHAQWLASGGGK